MNVRIDGVSVYQPGLARIDWNTLPVEIDDIDRIEVTRGPVLAVYGANSMLATINIMTKHPDDQTGTMLRGTVGSQHTREGVARHSGQFGKATTYRLTLSHRANGGYDKNQPDTLGHNDGIRVDQLAMHANTALHADEQLNWSATLVNSVSKKAFADRFQTSFPNVIAQDIYLNATWAKQLNDQHEIRSQAYVSQNEKKQLWTSCVPQATLLPELFSLWRSNPAYADTLLAGKMPTGGTVQDDALALAARNAILASGPAAAQKICTTPNQNYRERRFDWELQDTYFASPSLRMVSGAGGRAESGDSRTFLGGTVTNIIGRLFGNIEYKPITRLTINLGAYAEFDRLSGNSVSPRVSLNYRLTPQDTVRFSISSGARTPDILEQRANWSYAVSQGRFYQSALATEKIRRERIVSREIGYIANVRRYGAQADIKLFDDRLTELVSEKLQVSDFHPTNQNWARLRGAELQIRYAPRETWMAFANYAYLNNQASTILEQTQYARHSGAIGLSHHFKQGWKFSLAAYANSADSPSQSPYRRHDLTLSKLISFGSSRQIIASVTARHLQHRTVRYFENFCCDRSNSFDSAMQYFSTLELRF